MAELLEPTYTVHRFNMEPPPGPYVAAETRWRWDRVRHYWALRRPLRSALHEAPEAPVLWASISPHPLGHARDVLTVLPALPPGQPVYAVVHRATLHELFISAWTRPTARQLVRRLQGFVFLTASIAERCAPWIPAEKRLVIPNTIDDAVLCSEADVTAKQWRAPDRSLHLLFLSNMMPEKGYLDVLQAVGLLRERGVPLHAHFIGHWASDADRAAFETHLRSAALGDSVTHHGGISDRERIRAFHLAADVFLLPSYHPTEAMPLAILEALNAGTPVITTRHGGMASMVHHEREAMFVPPRDPGAIADAVQRLAAEDHWPAFSARARHRFETHFSPAAVRRRWEALLQRAGTDKG